MEYLNKLIQSSNTRECELIVNQIASLTHRLSQIEDVCSKKRSQIISEFITTPAITEPVLETACSDIIVAPPTKIPIHASNEETLPPIEIPDDSTHVMSTRDRLCNKIFKKMALVIHPDKCVDEAYKNLFQIASKAHTDFDVVVLIYLCQYTKIHLTFTQEELVVLSTDIDDLEKKISSLKVSMFYNWESMTEKQREKSIEILRRLNK